jgi:hypothetical protein
LIGIVTDAGRVGGRLPQAGTFPSPVEGHASENPERDNCLDDLAYTRTISIRSPGAMIWKTTPKAAPNPFSDACSTHQRGDTISKDPTPVGTGSVRAIFTFPPM